MAKTPMRCPFMGTSCKECAFYRGRHYYLCFSPQYRGHIPGTDETTTSPSRSAKDGYRWADFKGNFKVPEIIPANTYDPFLNPCNDIE